MSFPEFKWVFQKSGIFLYFQHHIKGPRPEWCISSMIIVEIYHSGRKPSISALQLSDVIYQYQDDLIIIVWMKTLRESKCNVDLQNFLKNWLRWTWPRRDGFEPPPWCLYAATTAKTTVTTTKRRETCRKYVNVCSFYLQIRLHGFYQVASGNCRGSQVLVHEVEKGQTWMMATLFFRFNDLLCLDGHQETVWHVYNLLINIRRQNDMCTVYSWIFRDSMTHVKFTYKH